MLNIFIYRLAHGIRSNLKELFCYSLLLQILKFKRDHHRIQVQALSKI